MYKREIQDLIFRQLYKGKAVIIYGPRRVGKTTLSKEIANSEHKTRYINCELLENKMMLEGSSSSSLKSFLGPYKLLVLDEGNCQRSENLLLRFGNKKFYP